MDEYTRGFDHAVRNIVATIRKEAAQDLHPERKLGLEVAGDIAEGYHGFLGREHGLQKHD